MFLKKPQLLAFEDIYVTPLMFSLNINCGIKCQNKFCGKVNLCTFQEELEMSLECCMNTCALALRWYNACVWFCDQIFLRSSLECILSLFFLHSLSSSYCPPPNLLCSMSGSASPPQRLLSSFAAAVAQPVLYSAPQRRLPVLSFPPLLPLASCRDIAPPSLPRSRPLTAAVEQAERQRRRRKGRRDGRRCRCHCMAGSGLGDGERCSRWSREGEEGLDQSVSTLVSVA